MEDNIKAIKDSATVGHYNPLRLEIFNINNNSIKSYEINMESNRVESYMYRCMCTIVTIPSRKSDVLIIFGGNPDVYGPGEFAVALDLKPTESGAGEKVFGRDFGDEIFKR